MNTNINKSVKRIKPGLIQTLRHAAIATVLAASSMAMGAVSFTGSQGNLAAEVVFDVSGSNLKVTLINTSLADTTSAGNALTGVAFFIPGNPSLGKVSAVVSAGSTVYENGVVPSAPLNGPDIAGEWGYVNSLSVSQYPGANQGISSAGLGLYGPGDRFDTNMNLAGPASLNGGQYGILSAGDDLTTNSPSYQGPMVKNSVDFVLSGLPSGFLLSNISSVTFQYGTGLDEPQVPGGPGPVVPEPASMSVIGGLFAAMGLRRRRQSKVKAD